MIPIFFLTEEAAKIRSIYTTSKIQIVGSPYFIKGGKMSEEKTVKIVFPESEREEEDEVKNIFYQMRMKGMKESRVFDVEEILNWFKKLEVKEIELWIETSVKSGNIVNLFISAEGKGGVKVTLVPKTAG